MGGPCTVFTATIKMNHLIIPYMKYNSILHKKITDKERDGGNESKNGKTVGQHEILGSIPSDYPRHTQTPIQHTTKPAVDF